MAVRIDILTLFPRMFEGPFAESIVKRAQDAGLVEIGVLDIRDWATDKHRTVDDTPYGGGAGMVMRPEPWAAALEAVLADAPESATAPRLLVPKPLVHSIIDAVIKSVRVGAGHAVRLRPQRCAQRSGKRVTPTVREGAR